MRIVFSLLLLSGCAAPFRFTPATVQAIAARRIGGELEFCLRQANHWPSYVRACRYAAASQCLAVELSADCGSIEIWFRNLPTSSVISPVGNQL